MRYPKNREVTHLEVDEASSHAERIVRIELDMPVPRVLERRLGAEGNEATGHHLGWEEHSTCDLNALTIVFDIRLPHLATRVTADGRYRLADGGDTEVVRYIQGRVDIDMPMIACMAERLIVSQLKDNMEEKARITADFLRNREHGDDDSASSSQTG